jgi:hypothetical protein
MAFDDTDEIDNVDEPSPEVARTASGRACALRRSSFRPHLRPLAFRARFVGIVGVVDVVDRPRSGEGRPAIRPNIAPLSRRPVSSSSRRPREARSPSSSLTLN